MTIFSLVGYIGFAALILTAIMQFFVRNVKFWLVSFLQNFCGILFVFSGWVKAIDPLGTAFKMQQYFDQFEVVFSDTALSFIAPLFPALNQYATAFSIIMIIFEIVLGIMLVLGAKPKFTSWAFFFLVLFFTALTGFTYLTGYVPEGVNFFSFGDWGAYQAKNMKVTDCGCFGDFIKLEPKVSFFKDVFLMIPALLFLWNYGKFHQWFTDKAHNVFIGVLTILLLLYSFNNFYWNEPHIDFRPFKAGTHVQEIKAMEEDAQAKVQVTGFLLQNKKTGEVKELPTAEFMKDFAKYPKDEWETLDQIKTEPSVKPSKISEFFLKTLDNEEAENMLLEDPESSIVIVSYKPYFTSEKNKTTIVDSVFVSDTLALPDGSTKIVRQLDTLINKEVETENITWDAGYLAAFQNTVKPFVDEAKKAGFHIYVITAGLSKEQSKQLSEASGIEGIYLTADDILLKTIMRSNPGVMHWKDGKIINKWHYKKLPSFDEAIR